MKSEKIRLTKNDMRIFHIIPSAFDYFDDISDRAFKLVDKLTDLGVDVDAMTVQYGTVKKSTERHVKSVAPSREYLGNVSVAAALEKAIGYDVIHVHCPMLGALGRILQIKRQFPEKPLIVTIYRSVPSKDLFSILIQLYNGYYLPRIKKAADAITGPNISAEELGDL